MNMPGLLKSLVVVAVLTPALSEAQVTFEVLHGFQGPPGGSPPYGALVLGTDGAVYGTTHDGGALGNGVVFKMNKDGTGFTELHAFGSTGGAYPSAGLLDSGGVLYGTTDWGGAYDQGVVFKINEDGTDFTKLFDFDDTNGAHPIAGTLVESGGVLYGTTSQGGTSRYGVVFKVNEDGTGFTKLHDFDLVNGGEPAAGLVDSGGVLYGTTVMGGASNRGVVFKINEDGTGFARLHDFDGTNGAGPLEQLVDSGGVLFGTTASGGASGNGVVFKISKDGTGFANLHDFDGTNGASPYGGLVDSGGVLYGTTDYGGASGYDGVVFKINKDGTGFAKLHDFDGITGAHPYAGLLDSGGALFGTTWDGGAGGGGIVFKINEDGTSFTKLHDFVDAPDGSWPRGGVVASGSALYGTTNLGGAYGRGVVFRMNEDGIGFTTLHDFNGADGANPYAGLVASGGVLYGTTYQGGVYGNGVVFRMNEDGTGFAKLHDFDGDANPCGGLVDSGGVLYGTTYAGGASNNGVVFRINEDGTGFAQLHYFVRSDGASPYAGLVDSGGVLYGTTYAGGAYDQGVVFKINADGTGFAKLYDFDFANGANPYAGLVDSGGVLYGTAYGGGAYGQGVVFKINEDGTGFTRLHEFDGMNGANPYAGLADSGGVLYGTTFGGMPQGVVFQINKDGSGFENLHVFHGSDGANPYAGLVASEGALYGTTQMGGPFGGGVIFRVLLPPAGGPRLLSVAAQGPGRLASAPEGIDCRDNTCTATFPGSTVVTLTASSDPGFVVQWSDGCSGGSPKCVVTLDADRNVIAQFVPGFSVSVTKSGSGRVVSQPLGIDCGSICEQAFTAGPVLLSAVPDAGWVFAGWHGACSGLGDCVVPGPNSASVGAQFDSIGTTYAVTVSTSGTGTVTSSAGGIDCGIDCSEAYPSGTTITLTANASTGYALVAWGGACSGRGVCTLTIDGPKAVTATFAAARFTESVVLPGVRGGRAAWGDYNNDGHLDAVVTSVYGPQWPVIYRNSGGVLVDSGIALDTGTGFAAWGDYDNAGALDLIAGGWVASPPGYVTKLYRNHGGTFVEVPAPLVGVSMGSQAAWGDYDNDGALDIVLCGYDNDSFVSKLYRNDHGTFVDTNTALAGMYYCDLAWGDYNNDGYLDLAITGFSMNGSITKIYRNDNGTLVDSGISLPGGAQGSVAWADYDGDGYLDLAIAGDSGNGLITKIYHNDHGTFVDSGANLVGIYDGSATWGDYDADGHPDLLVTGMTSDGQSYWPVTKLYRNDCGSFVEQFSGLPDLYSSNVVWGDYDGDGRLDLLMLGVYPDRNLDLYTAVYRNLSDHANTAPRPPSNPVATWSNEALHLSWDAASDAETPSSGLSYNVRVGTTPGGSEIVSAMADPATGLRRVVALGNAGSNTSFLLRGLVPGTYYWAVQAIDTSSAGSRFAGGGAFTVPTPVTLSINDVSVAEGNSGTTTAKFTVTLSAPAVQTVTVAYATADGTANAGSDYVARSGSLTFAPGRTSQTISVLVNGDRDIEPSETFFVNLTGPVGATLARSQGTGTIVSDEPPPPVTTEEVVWTHATGVQVSGNDLRKTAATLWGNAGAVSSRSIVIGDGYVEFVASETTTARMVGLSHGDTDADFRDIDFAVSLDKNAAQSVYERGISRGSFGTYAAGDRIRVAVKAGVVTYSRNGAIFYTSTQRPAYPLLVDAALRDKGATIRDAVISGSLIGHPAGPPAAP